jgi:hypothetical protein
MRKFLLSALLLVAGVQVAEASTECGKYMKLKQIGSGLTDSGVISTAGHDVRAIKVLCTSTACVAGFYDNDDGADQDSANAKIEVGGAASTFVAEPQTGYFETPFRFDSGISFVDDGNVAWVSMYECGPK